VSAGMERKRTPLWAQHKQLGARLYRFRRLGHAGRIPAGTIKEHKAVRTAVGLFDVSHMGEFVMRGERTREAVELLTTNAVASAARARRSTRCCAGPPAASSMTASSTSDPTESSS